MRKPLLVLALATALALGVMAPALAKGPKSQGKTTLDTTVISDSPNEMNYGSGIPNGEWVTAEVQGVVIGLRATDRTDGSLDVTGANGNRVGVYEAATGLDGSTADRAEWNYEWSVDLSAASANAAGRTIADYSLVLEQDFAPGLGTFDLPMTLPGVCSPDAVSAILCQQSWNPLFFNGAGNGYDVNAEGTYNLRLILTPATFNGPALAVAIRVNVTNG